MKTSKKYFNKVTLKGKISPSPSEMKIYGDIVFIETKLLYVSEFEQARFDCEEILIKLEKENNI